VTNKKEMTMSILLITYDHSKMSLMVDPIPNFVKEYEHVQLSKNSYAIETDEKTKAIFHKIKPYLSTNARLFILTLTQPFSGKGLEHVGDWLQERLP
jgi:hypothetical protein